MYFFFWKLWLILTIFYRLRIDGFLKQISVGDENNIWGINSRDEAFYRRGNIWVQGNLS